MPDSVGLGNRMWAEQVLRLRAVMPGAEQSLAGQVLRDLRMTQVPGRGRGTPRGGRGDRPGPRPDGGVAAGRAYRARGRPGHRRGDRGRGSPAGELRDRRLGAQRRQPAPRHRRPGHRERRPGRGRHRRSDQRRLLLRQHPDVRRRPAAGGVPRLLRGAARSPDRSRARPYAQASRRRASTPRLAT